MSAVYLTTDLMFSSRVASDAQSVGAIVEVAYSAEAMLEKLDKDNTKLVLIDLGISHVGLADLVAQIRTEAPQAAVIAYGPHVREALLKTATDAGCDQVLTQGQFNNNAKDLLETYCASGE